jgi:hypothetical protein
VAVDIFSADARTSVLCFDPPEATPNVAKNTPAKQRLKASKLRGLKMPALEDEFFFMVGCWLIGRNQTVRFSLGQDSRCLGISVVLVVSIRKPTGRRTPDGPESLENRCLWSETDPQLRARPFPIWIERARYRSC